MDSEVWCLLPAWRAGELRDPVNRILALEGVHVAIDFRREDRRMFGERRRRGGARTDIDRRRVRAADGRRVAGRRAATVPVEPPPVLNALEAIADELVFVRRLPPPPDRLADVESARLMLRLQSGDLTAFDELYERHHAQVSAYARRLLTDPVEAEDTVQEVFTKLFTAAKTFEIGNGSVGGWLLRVTRNAALDHLRKHGRVEVEDAHDIGERLEDAANEVIDHRAGDHEFFRRIRPLPSPQQQVLALRFAIGLPTAAIARTLKRTPASVRQLQHRGLSTLAVATEQAA
jgi:RNA polymerase sigma-70 factor (ECF subfamily)